VRAGGGLKYTSPNAVGIGTCSSWASACALQTAISTAISGNEIRIKAGVHYPGILRTETFALKNGVSILGGVLNAILVTMITVANT
jgi:hypothetical protein